MIPRVKEALGAKTDLEVFTSIIIRGREYIRLIYTTCYVGNISDIKKTKYLLLYILERFKKNHNLKSDPLINLLKKYETTYDEIENLISEEYHNTVEDFGSLNKSI